MFLRAISFSLILSMGACSAFQPITYQKRFPASFEVEQGQVEGLVPFEGAYSFVEGEDSCPREINFYHPDVDFIVTKLMSDNKKTVQALRIGKLKDHKFVKRVSYEEGVLRVETKEFKHHILGINLPIKVKHSEELYYSVDNHLYYDLLIGKKKKDRKTQLHCEYDVKAMPTPQEPVVNPNPPVVEPDDPDPQGIDYGKSENIFTAQGDYQLILAMQKMNAAWPKDDSIAQKADGVLSQILSEGLVRCGVKYPYGIRCLEFESLSGAWQNHVMKFEKGIRHVFSIFQIDFGVKDKKANILHVIKLYAETDSQFPVIEHSFWETDKVSVDEASALYHDEKLKELIMFSGHPVKEKADIVAAMEEASSAKTLYHLMLDAQALNVPVEDISKILGEKKELLTSESDENYLYAFLKAFRESIKIDMAVLKDISEKMLSSDNAQIAQLAAITLAEYGEKSSFIKELVVASLKNSSWQIRLWGLKAFYKTLMETDLDADIVLAMVLDKDSDVVKEAKALSLKLKLTPANFEQIAQLAQSKSWEIRHFSIDLLKTLSGKNVQNLMFKLGLDSDGDVRKKAQGVLMSYQLDESDFAQIEKYTAHSSWELRVFGVKLLNKVATLLAQKKIIAMALDSDSDARKFALDLVKKMKLTEEFQNDFDPYLVDKRWDVRREGIYQVDRLKTDESTKKIILMLKDGDSDVRVAAWAALERREIKAPHLVQLVGVWTVTRVEDVQKKVLTLMSKIKTQEALDAIYSGAQTSGNWDVRRAAVQKMALYEGDIATKYLITRLVDSDSDVRKSVTDILDKRVFVPSHAADLIAVYVKMNSNMEAAKQKLMGYMLKSGSPDTAANLYRISAQDGNWSSRREAIRALAKINTAESTNYLIKRLVDSDDDVLSDVISTLNSRPMTDQELKTLSSVVGVVKKENVVVAITNYVAKAGTEDAVSQLIQLMNYSNWSIRRLAVQKLSAEPYKANSRVTGALLKKVLDSDSDVVAAVKTALGSRVIGAEHVGYIADTLLAHSNWSQRAYAASLLGRIDSSAATSALKDRLTVEKDSDVIRAIQAALK